MGLHHFYPVTILNAGYCRHLGIFLDFLTEQICVSVNTKTIYVKVRFDAIYVPVYSIISLQISSEAFWIYHQLEIPLNIYPNLRNYLLLFITIKLSHLYKNTYIYIHPIKPTQHSHSTRQYFAQWELNSCG